MHSHSADTEIVKNDRKTLLRAGNLAQAHAENIGTIGPTVEEMEKFALNPDAPGEDY